MGFKLTTLVVIGTDCVGKYKSNYHTIMATTAPYIKLKSEVCLPNQNHHFNMKNMNSVYFGILPGQDHINIIIILSV
jgi:hypothetical protein